MKLLLPILLNGQNDKDCKPKKLKKVGSNKNFYIAKEGMKWYNHIVELLGSFLKVTFTFSLSDSTLSYLSERKRNRSTKISVQKCSEHLYNNTSAQPSPTLQNETSHMSIDARMDKECVNIIQWNMH